MQYAEKITFCWRCFKTSWYAKKAVPKNGVRRVIHNSYCTKKKKLNFVPARCILYKSKCLNLAMTSCSNSHFKNAFSTATSLELDDDFDVSVPTARRSLASFNISTNIEPQEEITEKWVKLFEPRHKKTFFFAYAKTKAQILIVQSLFLLIPKFQASSHLESDLVCFYMILLIMTYRTWTILCT